MRSYFAFVISIAFFICQNIAANENPIKCPLKPEDQAAVSKLAGELFNRGELCVKAQDFDQALAAFSCSLQMVEHKATLHNIAKSAELVTDKPEAARQLKLALAVLKDEEIVEGVKKIIEDLGVDISDQPIASASTAPIPVEPPPAVEKVAPQPPVREAAAPAEQIKPRAAPVSQRSNWTTLGYVALGAGSASLITGVVLAALANQAKTRGEETSDPLKFKNYKDDLKGYQLGAILSFVAGGLIGGAGVAVIMIAHKQERADVAIALSGNAIAISGRF